MNFFLSGTFWFFEGILFCLVVIGLKIWTDDKKIEMNIWKWITVTVWILFLEFSIAFVTTSLGENEPTAALMGGILFGIISIVSGVALFRLVGFAGMKKVQPGEDE